MQRSRALTDEQRRRLLARLGPRLRHGVLRLVAETERSQTRNRAAARDRLAALVRDGLAPPPPPRRATRPTLGSRERRLGAKRRRGEVKAGRGDLRRRPD